MTVIYHEAMSFGKETTNALMFNTGRMANRNLDSSEPSGH